MAARSSFSSVKAISALVADNLSIAAASRRTYAAAAASQGMTTRSGSARMAGGGNKAPKEESVEKSWIPDPRTGYYRPANRGNEIDVAELRRALLKNRTGSH